MAFGKKVPGSLAAKGAKSTVMSNTTSMSQGTSTGSGSRPGKGKTMTPSSAPADLNGLSRKPPGALK